MSIRIRTGSWEELREQAQAIRYQVFVIEQKVPVELEWDEMDAQCLHALACNEQGQALGTGRLLPDGHIGRMAVLADARGHGVGSRLLQELMAAARTRGDAEVVLSAQLHAEPFYARHGFAREGGEYMDAGIPHVSMRRRL